MPKGRSSASSDRSDERSRSSKEPARTRRADRSSEEEEGPQLPRPDLSDVPEAILIDTQDALEEMLAELEGIEELGVDTEADSFYSYREKVCLIQLTYRRQDWLVDPLCGLDLSGLGEIFADPDVVKIFHDGEFDVTILKRRFGFTFANLFDTSIAAQALGRKEIGLAAILAAQFGFALDKSQQLSDWSKRPLSPKQIRYARLDTRYLSDLRDQFEDELEETGRLEVHDGEVARLEALEPPAREFDPDEFVKLKGVNRLSLAQAAVLRELFIERNEMAESADRPPFQIVPHGALVEMAQRPPRDSAGIARLKGMPKRTAHRHGDRLLDAIERGLEAGPLDEMPTRPSRDGVDHLDEFGRELFDRLKKQRTKWSERERISTPLVLNRHVLPRLAEQRPRTLAELGDVEGLLAWQRRAFGDELVAIIDRFESAREDGSLELPRHRRKSR